MVHSAERKSISGESGEQVLPSISTTASLESQNAAPLSLYDPKVSRVSGVWLHKDLANYPDSGGMETHGTGAIRHI